MPRAQVIGGLGIIGLAMTMLGGCAPASASAEAEKQHASAPMVVTGDVTGDAQSQLQAAGVHGPTVILVVDSVLTSNCEDLARQLREVLHSSLARNRATVVLTPARDSAGVSVWLHRERIASVRVVTYMNELVVGHKPVRGAAVLIINERLHVASGVSHPVIVANTRPQSFAKELGAK